MASLCSTGFEQFQKLVAGPVGNKKNAVPVSCPVGFVVVDCVFFVLVDNVSLQRMPPSGWPTRQPPIYE